MTYINLVAAVMILLFLIAYYLMREGYICEEKIKEDLKSEKGRNANKTLILGIIVVGLIFRVICAFFIKGHEDLKLFSYWGTVAYKYGFGKFYKMAGFADYPPGYIYILYVIEWIKNIFHIASDTKLYYLIMKMPAILSDIITGVLVYKISRKNDDGNVSISFIILILYLLNPVIIINSSAWGQVDSLFCLGIICMCYFVYINKTRYAYMAYFFAMLIKPQAIIFTPIIIFAFIEESFLCKDESENVFGINFNKKELVNQLKWLAISLVGMCLIILPFGIIKVLKQYKSTVDSYPYASVNAYNMWSMFGLDFVNQNNVAFALKYVQWGTIFIVCIVFGAFMMWLFRAKYRDRYFACAIFISAAMFTISVRMHERYLYPAVILILILFIIKKSIKVYWLYAAFSVAHFYNVAHVLFVYDVNHFNARELAIIAISALNCLVFGCFCVYCYNNYIREETSSIKDIDIKTRVLNHLVKGKKNMNDDEVKSIKKELFTKNIIRKSKVFDKITKVDIVIILTIMVIYSFFALRDLGDKTAPDKFYELNVNSNENSDYAHIIIEVEPNTKISELSYYLGNYEERKFAVYVSDDGKKWERLEESDYKDKDDVENKNIYEMHSVFCWDSWLIERTTKYIQLVAIEKKCSIGEIVLIDDNNEVIKPINANDDSLKGLFDEQNKFPKRFSFRNSTHFDEVYHARSAYEFIKGRYCYEWTHPPLGKFFISLGIRIFGMCPFGWRIAGTVFGILMVPAVYLFARRIFNKRFFAIIACILFTFDFMHFVQTRIATIDVYVTFFIIWMYYFMYKYYSMSFYDKKLLKTFIPLICCGFVTGFGIASKWTGVYAAGGLAVIFFYTMYIRYYEYRYACKYPDGETEGIKHKHIIETFKGNFLKTVLLCVGVFIVVPAIIYTLSYIPFVPVDEAPKDLIGRMLYNQKQMFNYHSNIVFEHPFASPWYEWPLMIRPIYYYSGKLSNGMREGISAFGNPLVWWVGMPAFVYLVYRCITKKDKKSLFLVIGYMAQLLPWILVKRLTFIYHYFPSVPFVVLMIVYSIYGLTEDRRKKGKTWIIAPVVYTTLVVVMFLMFYPVLSGQPVSPSYVKTWLRWIHTWVLVS